MREKDFQTQFAKKNKVIGAFELKFCKGKSLPFTALATHQEAALLAFSNDKGLYHKITDSPFFKDPKGRMRFTKPKPFDAFFISNTPAYVVVMWWVPRKKKTAYYIRIENWIKAKKEVGRKSLTEEAALEYAEAYESYLKK